MAEDKSGPVELRRGGGPEDSGPCPDPLSRWVLAGIAVGFVVVAFAQAWGLIQDDTELPLVMAPLAFMHAALDLWNQSTFAGFANPQSAGLLFPMGPFFALTHLLHVPTWCAERLWLALLLTVGCWGVVRLAEALGIGARWARVLAGVAYCVAPIVLTWVSTSAALLAVVLLPWVIHPLVVGSRAGSPRRAAACSGVAVALMGGVNATVIVAVLPVAAIWLLTRQPGPRRRALMGWWVLAVGLACFWWAVPLVLASTYTYNYLVYSESATVTTSTASAFEALRGASYWLDYETLGGVANPGAWTVVATGVVVMATSVVTALGLAGLCRRIPERLFLVASLCVGVVAIGAGYAGAAGGPLAHGIQHLLGTSLAPLRSVGKFSPDVGLPLALGLASLVSARSWGGARWHIGRFAPTSAQLLGAVRVIALAAVLVAATPFWHLQLYKPGGFAAIPGYWSQAGSWLDAHQGDGNALLVPGAAFADYTWGDTSDEPLQVVAHTSVEWRNLIPLGSNGNTQMLETVEQVLDDGTSPPGFAEYLSREGIEYVVERNDLNLASTGAPPPAQVHQVLSESPGLTEVASFGPVLPLAQVTGGRVPAYSSPQDLELRPVEIFRVDPPGTVVQTYPAADPLVVSGDTGSLLPLATAGVLTGRAAVLAGDPRAGGVTSAAGATWVITDGNQRRDQLFGTIHDNLSYLLGPGQRTNLAQPSVPQAYIVVPGEQHQTVEDPIGAASIAASSYGSYSFDSDPDEGPAAAFDDDPQTAWVANATDGSVGQWVSITFDHPLRLTTITIDPLAGSSQQPTVSRVTITTDRGSVQRSLPATTAPQRLSVPRGVTRSLTVRIDAVRPAAQPSPFGEVGAGFADVLVPGVSVHLRMRVPDDEGAAFAGPGRQPPIVVFSSPVTDPNLSLGPTQNDDPDMARLVVLPKPMSAGITGTVIPSPGTPLEGLLEQLAPPTTPTLSVTASSWLGDLPRFRPENLVEDSASPWMAGLGDADPSVDLLWSQPTSVDSLDLGLTPEAAAPTEISVTDGSETRVVAVPPKGGLVRFAPLVTKWIVIHFLHVTHRTATAPTTGLPTAVPVGLASVRVPAIGSAPATATPLSTPVALACGVGPTVVVDGVDYPTSVSGTVGDLVNLQAMDYTVCGPAGGVPLAAGAHNFAVIDSGVPFESTSLVAQDPTSLDPASVRSPRAARIERWNANSRTVAVGAGPATYLAVAQNYSVGWTATLDGRTLTPVRLDGWQQGFLVPAGRAGTVTITMSRAALFHFALALGAALLAGLLLLALVPPRRRAPDSSGPRPLPAVGVLMAGAGVVLVLVAGLWALVAVPLLWAAWRWGRGPMAATAFVAFVLAGAAVAWDAGALPASGVGAFGALAQVASVMALAAVLCALVVEARRPAGPGAQSPDPEGREDGSSHG